MWERSRCLQVSSTSRLTLFWFRYNYLAGFRSEYGVGLFIFISLLHLFIVIYAQRKIYSKKYPLSLLASPDVNLILGYAHDGRRRRTFTFYCLEKVILKHHSRLWPNLACLSLPLALGKRRHHIAIYLKKINEF